MKNIMVNILNKRTIILLSIFLTAVFLRLAGNFIREVYVFNKPFAFYGDELSKNYASHEIWYGKTAEALYPGKGIGAIDINFYTNPAELLNRNDVLLRQIGSTSYYYHNYIAPLYPVFLALFFLLFGVSTWAFFLPQVLIGALTCVLIYILAEELFDTKTAFLSAIAVTFYPDLIFWTYTMRPETIFIFFLTLSFWLIHKGTMEVRFPLLAAGAASYGLVCLTRNSFTPFIPILIFWVLMAWDGSIKKKLLAVLISTIVVSAVLFPWALHNKIVFHRFSPMLSEVSNIQAFKMSINPRYTGPSSKETLITLVRQNPAASARHFAKKFIYFWGAFGSESKPFARIYKTTVWIIIFPLAFWGIFRIGERWSRVFLLYVFILYYSIVHSFSFVDYGLILRYPIQPFISIFFAYGFFNFYERLKLP